MTQPKLSSFYEACINIIIGFALNFALNLWLIPAFVTDATGRPAHISLVDNWWMGCAYTVFSLHQVIKAIENSDINAPEVIDFLVELGQE